MAPPGLAANGPMGLFLLGCRRGRNSRVNHCRSAKHLWAVQQEPISSWGCALLVGSALLQMRRVEGMTFCLAEIRIFLEIQRNQTGTQVLQFWEGEVALIHVLKETFMTTCPTP